MGKSEYHKENEKRMVNGNQEKRTLQFVWNMGISSGKFLEFTVSLEPSVPLHQHEEACVEDCVCPRYFNIDA